MHDLGSPFLSLPFLSQEFHKNHLQSRLEGATRDVDSLNNDVDTLKAGLNAIVEIFQTSAGEPATPTHEYEASSTTSLKGRETTPLKGGRVGKASGASVPNWVTSPVS